jgi:arsenite methyltransferase
MDATFSALDVVAACGGSAVLGALTYHVMVAKRRIAAAVRAALSSSSSSSSSSSLSSSSSAASGDSMRDQDLVREAYHKTVTRNKQREEETSSSSAPCCQVVQGVAGSRIGYSPEDLAAAGTTASTTMLGCGTPVDLADLQPGETVLDLGCGVGVDCLIAARRVGPSGAVIGVDMTPAMLAEARKQAAKAASLAAASKGSKGNGGGGGGGMADTSFRLGEIEHLPVADGCVDCIISNCVINLSPDKPQVYAEMFRVLRGGGRLSISDVLREVQELPEHLRTAQALAC